MTAFGGTAAVFFAMATLATVIKRDLSGMGKFLTVGVVIIFVAMLLVGLAYAWARGALRWQ